MRRAEKAARRHKITVQNIEKPIEQDTEILLLDAPPSRLSAIDLSPMDAHGQVILLRSEA